MLIAILQGIWFHSGMYPYVNSLQVIPLRLNRFCSPVHVSIHASNYDLVAGIAFRNPMGKYVGTNAMEYLSDINGYQLDQTWMLVWSHTKFYQINIFL